MDNLKMLIPGRPEYMTMIRLATSSLAALAGFDIDDQEDIKLAVVEACKNVSCHGCEAFSDQYQIEFKVDNGSIQVTVTDACDRHTLPKNGHQCKRCPEEGDIGAIMLRTLMKSVEFGRDEHGHKFIFMVK